jgi:gas vesicle protein
MSDRNPSDGFLVGFFTGAVIGLSIGFIFAPHTGEETQEILKEKAAAAKEKVSEFADKIRETASDIKRKSRQNTV